MRTRSLKFRGEDATDEIDKQNKLKDMLQKNVNSLDDNEITYIMSNTSLQNVSNTKDEIIEAARGAVNRMLSIRKLREALELLDSTTLESAVDQMTDDEKIEVLGRNDS